MPNFITMFQDQRKARKAAQAQQAQAQQQANRVAQEERARLAAPRRQDVTRGYGSPSKATAPRPTSQQGAGHRRYSPSPIVLIPRTLQSRQPLWSQRARRSIRTTAGGGSPASVRPSTPETQRMTESAEFEARYRGAQAAKPSMYDLGKDEGRYGKYIPPEAPPLPVDILAAAVNPYRQGYTGQLTKVYQKRKEDSDWQRGFADGKLLRKQLTSDGRRLRPELLLN